MLTISLLTRNDTHYIIVAGVVMERSWCQSETAGRLIGFYSFPDPNNLRPLFQELNEEVFQLRPLQCPIPLSFNQGQVSSTEHDEGTTYSASTADNLTRLG
jgi:hypothetical protein